MTRERGSAVLSKKKTLVYIHCLGSLLKRSDLKIINNDGKIINNDGKIINNDGSTLV